MFFKNFFDNNFFMGVVILFLNEILCDNEYKTLLLACTSEKNEFSLQFDSETKKASKVMFKLVKTLTC